MKHVDCEELTLGIQAGLSSLVLGDLMHGVLLACLVLAKGPLGLWHVHLKDQAI